MPRTCFEIQWTRASPEYNERSWSETKQLINIAIQTCNKNPTGVKMHAIMAKKSGATRDEVLGAVVMNLHLSGLLTVLECLPSAIVGYDSDWTSNISFNFRKIG